MSIIVKIDPIKSEAHLRVIIPYIMKEEKTHGLTYSNVGVTPTEITDAFFLTKEKFKNKTRGIREGYHVKFSFAKDMDVSDETALEYVKTWAEEYLDSIYDYVVAVHSDRDHKHMHLVFNSVSICGEKFRMDKNEVREKVRPLTNKVSKMYGSSGIRERDKTKDYSKPSSWKDRVQSDMDKCLSLSKSYGDFKKKMREIFGYTLREGVSREHGLYLALTPPDKAKAIRTYRLDAGYMPADIEERIANAKGKSGVVWERVKREFIPYKELSDYQKAFIRKALAANSLYRRSGTSLHMHEVSVTALRNLKTEYRQIEKEFKKNIEIINERKIDKEKGKDRKDVQKLSNEEFRYQENEHTRISDLKDTKDIDWRRKL